MPVHPHVKKVHGTAKTVVPIIAAVVTLSGALLQYMDSQQPQGGTPAKQEGTEPDTSGADLLVAPPKRLGAGSVLLTLVGRVFLVLISLALITGLVWLWLQGSDVSRAVILTLLLVGIVWLAVEVSRRK